MTQIQIKKQLVHSYFQEAFRLKTLNGIVDDYDICKSTGNQYESIANLKLPLLSTLEHIVQQYDPHTLLIDGDNVIFKNIDGTRCCVFSFILTPLLSFSGNVGINAVAYDGGVQKHLEYLSLFFPSDIHPLKNLTCISSDEEGIRLFYINFYNTVETILQKSPMSLYNLLTGIKKNYNLLDHGILLDNDGFHVVDFTKLKNPDFINNFSEVEIEASETSPMLKVSYQGSKILHIRTKIEKKNSSFKLRFFIETSSKFLKLFTKE